MTQKTAKQFSPELHERAVRMVQDREREGGSRWESIGSGDFAARSADIAAKFGCSREALVGFRGGDLGGAVGGYLM